MTATPDPAIVAALYNLDLELLFAEPADLRRRDGTPASPDEVETYEKASVCDMRAVVDMHHHTVEQTRYELTRKERIVELLDKYALRGDEHLDVIEQRMTLPDWIKYRTLWAELGNTWVMVDRRQGP